MRKEKGVTAERMVGGWKGRETEKGRERAKGQAGEGGGS